MSFTGIRRASVLLTFLAGSAMAADAPALRWTPHDNGAEIDWPQAVAYCSGLGAGWRLPSTTELASLAATSSRQGERTPCGNASCQAPAQWRLSAAWFWSGNLVTPEQDREHDRLAWGVTLANGRPTKAFKLAAYGSRALCVQEAA